MSFLVGIFIFLLGLAVGSFLNVVILRYGTGASIRGRSHCPSCGRMLSWRELIPLVSFLIQRGKCFSCGVRISLQYPLVELLTGALFLGLFFKVVVFSPDVSITLYAIRYTLYAIVMSLLITIAVYDYHHKIIPNEFVYPLILLSLLPLFSPSNFLVFYAPQFMFYDFLAAPILFSPFALLWLISHGTWMGFGDAKLAWALGWLLGLLHGVTAVVFAFWIGAAYFLLLLAIQNVVPFAKSQKRLKMKSEVPFGPFLIIGFLLVFFTGIDVFTLITFFL